MRQQPGQTRPRLGVPRHALNVRDCLIDQWWRARRRCPGGSTRIPERTSPRITGSIARLPSLRLNHSIILGSGFGLVASHNTLASSRHLTSVPSASCGVGAFRRCTSAVPPAPTGRTGRLLGGVDEERQLPRRRHRVLRGPLHGDLAGETVDGQLVRHGLQPPCWPLTRCVNAGNHQFVFRSPLCIRTFGLANRARPSYQQAAESSFNEPESLLA